MMSATVNSRLHGRKLTTTASLSLSDLPLRPSTLQRFMQRGFETTSDVDDARRFGLSNLAAELDCDDITEVAGLLRELDGCLNNLLGRCDASESGIFGCDDNDSFEVNNMHSCSSGIRGYGGIIRNFSPTNVTTASELMNPLRGDHGTVSTHIVTFSQKVDDLLGGGIRLGEVTEIAGLPGCGKTQLATQLSVLARLPTTFGGVQGRTLYIDTEGSFTPERAHDMAEALHIHVQDGIERRRKRAKRSSNGNSNQKTNHQVDAAQERDAAAFTEEEILRSIHVFRVHDETALISTLYSLPQYIENSEYLDDEILGADNGTSDCSSTDSLPVRLVVIDSIAFPFRAVAPTDPSYYAQRSKTLTTLASFLGDLATKYNIAVVAINQMTTKMTPSSLRTGGSYADNITALVPALGEAWAHATATRLLLSNSFGPESRIDDSADSSPSQPQQQPSRNQQIRVCELAKSSHRPSGSAKFVIVPEGIRGVEYISHKRPAQAPTAASTTAPQPLQGDTNLHHQSISNGSNKRHLHK